MTSRRILCVSVAAIAVVACWSPRQERAAIPQQPCFAPESGAVAYGAIDVDSGETGDASGVQFSCVVRGDSLHGFVRDARGQMPQAVPLREVRFDPATDTVSFWYGDRTRYRYRYHMDCRALSGIARLFVTDRDTGAVRTDTVMRAPLITRP